MDRLRQRLTREDGFTLIEMLVVMVIIAILLGIAVPSYLGYRSRAQETKAESNIRQAIPSAATYYSDNGSYTGMTTAKLTSSYDSGLAGDPNLQLAVDPSGNNYGFDEPGQTGTTWYYYGPGGTVTSTKPNAICP